MKKVGENIEIAMMSDLNKCGAIKHGHFLLTSGNHSNLYIDKDMIFHFPELRNRVLYFFDQLLYINNIKPTIFMGPPQAGNLFASMMAHKMKTPFIPMEKNKHGMFMRPRHRAFIMNEEVCVVEDMITSGGSVGKAVDYIRGCGAAPTIILCLWNRTGYSRDDIPILPIISTLVASYTKEECPLCDEGMALQDPKA